MFKLRLPIVAAVALLCALAASAGAEASERLANPGFEEGASGWGAMGGTLEAITAPRTGALAGRLVSNGTDTAPFVYQTVPVQPLATYTASGWLVLPASETGIDDAAVKVTWLDASNNHVGEVSAPPLTLDAVEPTTYTIDSTGPITAPTAAVTARFSVLAHGTGQFTIYLDDLSFVLTAEAPTPTATPLVTPSPTPSPSPSPSAPPTPKATPMRTPTRTPTPSPAPTPRPTPKPPITPGPEPAVFATLANGGFEQAGQDGPYGWRKIGGTLSRDGAHHLSGGYSLALASASSSSKWAYQTVTVEAGAYYRARAFAAQSGPRPGDIFLRVSWYASGDGSGEAISSDDSTAAVSNNTSTFRELSTDPLQVPPGARTARVRLMFRPASDASATAYFDDVSFETVPAPTDAPATPTPHPTATVPGATPTPTSHPGPTNHPPAVTSTPGAAPTPPSQPQEPSIFSSLVNGGFEEAREDGTPYGWRKNGGEFAVSDSYRTEGGLALEITSDSATTKWVYQSVAVSPGARYQATAWALSPGRGDELFLRISWYASADGSGSALTDTDSFSTAVGPAGSFVLLDTGAVQAPPGTRSARLRLMLRPGSAAPTRAYFDDVRFVTASTANDTADPGAAAGGAAGHAPPVATGDSPGALLGAAATPVNGSTKDALQAAAPGATSGSGSDWLLALALAVPIGGIAAAVGIPYLRRKNGPGPPAA